MASLDYLFLLLVKQITEIVTQNNMSKIEIVVLLGLLCGTVFIVNLYCIVIIILNKTLHRPSHIAICSLLIAHFLQSIFVIPSYAVKKAGTGNKTVVCDTFRLSYLFTNYASCLSLLVITLDRFIGVRLPLRYHIIVTTRRMLYLTISIWMYSLLLNLIPFIPNHAESVCNYNPPKIWTVFMLLGNTLLPFLIIAACYMVIFKKARKVLTQRKLARGNTDRRRLASSHFNKSKITLLIVFFYVLCWGPSCCYYLLQSLCKTCFNSSYRDSNTEDIIHFTMKLLTFIDGIIAPLIYCCTNATFNRARRRMSKQLRQLMQGGSVTEFKRQPGYYLHAHLQEASPKSADGVLSVRTKRLHPVGNEDVSTELTSSTDVRTVDVTCKAQSGDMVEPIVKDGNGLVYCFESGERRYLSV